MAMEEDGNSKIKDKAASIARDITVASASGSQNTNWIDGPKAFDDGLTLVYETVYPVALKSLGKQSLSFSPCGPLNYEGLWLR